MRKFLVLSLPRSRSKWLSTFLSYGGREVGHDLAANCGSIAEFQQVLAKHSGSCETGAMLGWKLLLAQKDAPKVVLIRRSVGEVLDSFAKFGIFPLEEEMYLRDAMLEAASKVPGVTSFSFEDLDSREACLWLFEKLLGTDFDDDWWEGLRHQNIQVNMGERLLLLHRNFPRLEALKAEIIAATAALPQGGLGWLN